MDIIALKNYQDTLESSNIVKLNKEQILEYQKNRDPYLMIDFVEELVPGKSAKGYKICDKHDWYFKVHWEGDPNMPGMLQIESLIQMSALTILSLPGNKGKTMYLTSANNLKFVKKVIPGDKLHIITEVKSYKRGLAICRGKGYINKQIACQAEFSLILPDEIKKYNLKN
tara:strand:- start:230 stop:739 length:510 start_codon:yes stop_codon:yes gene_type:complete